MTVNELSEIVEVTERPGETFSAMRIYLAEMMDAIEGTPSSCSGCEGSVEIHVPVDTPLQWKVDFWHNEGCTVHAPNEARGLRVVR